MGVLSGLNPESVFYYFEEICKIPHGSGNTKQMSDFIVTFAKERNLKYRQDESNNVIIWKEGSKGYEDAEPVMLQGHMDMVCEKEQDCDIDFATEGLRLEVKDGTITAKGTTLGGDDGIAVAFMLAILDSNDIMHPPVEMVFTVDEEIGLLGASAMDTSDIKSHRLLNLDSEEEGILLVGCAGGVTATAHLPITFCDTRGIRLRLTLDGLQGGHSGVEIDKGRGNACMILGRVLQELQNDPALSFQLIFVEGGQKDNAIPRIANAELILTKGTMKEVEALVRSMEEVLRNELRVTDPEVVLSVTLLKDCNNDMAMTEISTQQTIAVLRNLPDGIQRMSFDIEGLVQTSLNLGILKTKETEVSFSFSVRSSVGSEKEELVKRMKCLLEAFGGKVTCQGEYPAWEYRQDSPLRDLMVETFEQLYGHQPEVQTIHAGLECGLFSDKIKDLDSVSFGPDMKNIHTPKESMDVESVRRTWEYTLEVLKRMK